MVLGRNDLAGKTGTTNDYRDAWFSGFGGGIVTTAWVGMDDFGSLGRGELGGPTALPAWIGFMRTALAERPEVIRSEEHTSELQSLMRISYAVFCLKKQKKTQKTHTTR